MTIREQRPISVSTPPSVVSKAPSIASVTIAYNGANALRRHLESLKGQSRRLDEIVVVDNASTDDTLKLLTSDYPDVKVLRLPRNSGVGGGLAVGLAYAALQKKHDWVWIFDQDSVPAQDALERLLDGLQLLNGTTDTTAILAPVCVHAETGMLCHGLAWRGSRLRPTAVGPNERIRQLDSVISSGSLVRSLALEKAGLPRADFFIDFVDHEHCLRLRRAGYTIVMVRDSRVQHALGEPARFNFLGRTKYWSNHAPWREYYMARNEVFTMWRYFPSPAIKGLVVYGLAKHALEILLFGKDRMGCLGMMYRGFVDGRAGRLGIHAFAHNARD